METMKLVFIIICYALGIIASISLFSFLTIGISTFTLQAWNDLQEELTRRRNKK